MAAACSAWLQLVRTKHHEINPAMNSIPTILIAALTLSAGIFAGLARAAADQWPQFLGPHARAIGTNANLPDQWSATKNVAWKAAIPGRGWSSPIAWGNRVFLTTVVVAGNSKLPKKGLYLGGERRQPPPAEHQWKVLCLDLASGKVLWERLVHHGAPPEPRHLKNSYASETPVTDGQRLYAYFGNVGVFCFDFEGRPVWSKTIPPHKMRSNWGTASSPVLFGDRLYLVDDNDQDSYLLALDKRTGAQVWRVHRDEKSNWSTPYIWENGRQTEIITPGTGKTRGYDPSGKLLWWFKGMSSITIATPYSDHGLLYVSSGFVMNRRRPLYAIRPTAAGDISLHGQETSNAAIAWCQPRGAPYNPTTLVYDGRLYALYDTGRLSVFDPQTGKIIYERKVLPRGLRFTASPWAYQHKVFCMNEDGLTFVVAAGDKFEVLRTNPLPADDMYLATPAMVGDRLLIRSASRLYCIRGPSSR